jgi:hypothetical protein
MLHMVVHSEIDSDLGFVLFNYIKDYLSVVTVSPVAAASRTDLVKASDGTTTLMMIIVLFGTFYLSVIDHVRV